MAHGRIDVGRFGIQFEGAGIVEEVLDDFVESIDLSNDHLKKFTSWLRVVDSLQELGGTFDARERVSDLMRQARSHGAQSC